MQTTIPDEKLISYLLGAALTEAEQDEIEQRYFSDDAFLEQIEALEMGLMVRYLRDDLSSAERDLFESRFLMWPERRESLQFLRKLFPEKPHNPQAEAVE